MEYEVEKSPNNNVIAVIGILMIVGLLCLFGYYYIKNTKSQKDDTNITTTIEEKIDDTVTFDVNKLTRKHVYSKLGNEYEEIYYGDNKIDLGYEGEDLEQTSIIDIKYLQDIAIIFMGFWDDVEVHIINSNGKILKQYKGYIKGNSPKPTDRWYGFDHVSGVLIYDLKINGNKIYFYSSSLGQDAVYNACNMKDSAGAEYVDVVEYKNGKLSEVKNISKKTVAEYKKENNVKCN